MCNGNGKKRCLFLGLVSLLFVGAFAFVSLNARAAENPTVRQVVSDENRVKIYVSGTDAAEEGSCQFGSTAPVEDMTVRRIGEDEPSMRTLLLLDNSLSVSKEAQEKIREVLLGILDAHGEKERFRLATFSDHISYLTKSYTDDYTALKYMVGGISYQNQETYLTDVLMDVVKELNGESYFGYTRLVVISDGVDNKTIGIKRDELESALKNQIMYPIYTLGVWTGDNGNEISSMFSLSRYTGVDYYLLGESATGEIVGAFAKDGGLVVYEAVIPEKAKTGGRENCKISLAGGVSLTFAADMPFHIEQETEQNREQETDVKADFDAPVESDALPDGESTRGRQEKWKVYAVFAAVAALVVLVVCVVVFCIKKAGKSNIKGGKGSDVWGWDEGTTILDKLMMTIIGSKKKDEPDDMGGECRLRISLIYSEDRGRSASCEMTKEIRIGMGEDNALRVGEQGDGISRHHCRLYKEGGSLFIQDVGSRYGTAVNGVAVRRKSSERISSGDALTLGGVDFIFNCEECG